MSVRHHWHNTNELHTLRDWLRYAVSAFNEAQLTFGHGSANAYDEAAYLILHTLHLPLDTLTPFLDARLTLHEKNVLLTILKNRIEKKIPAAYLTNEAWLGDFNFYVDERVIIPRSYIAELLRDSVRPWIEDPDSVTDVLDMCTGSGCLAIVAAHAFSNAQVDAVDLSADALHVAQRNVGNYHLDARVHLIQSDLFSALTNKKYDLIISNPPYVDAPSLAALPAEYRREPVLALGSGEDGLDAIRVILSAAAAHLKPHGILIVEIGHNKSALEAAYPNLPFTWLEVSAGDEFVLMLRLNDIL